MDQAIKLSKLDLEALSIEDLTSLIERAQFALEKMEQARIKELRQQARALAKARKVTIEELLGLEKPSAPAKRGTKKRQAKTEAKRKGARTAVRPKYRNPADRSETWSGRGRMPRWMHARIKKGSKREDFLIQ